MSRRLCVREQRKGKAKLCRQVPLNMRLDTEKKQRGSEARWVKDQREMERAHSKARVQTTADIPGGGCTDHPGTSCDFKVNVQQR